MQLPPLLIDVAEAEPASSAGECLSVFFLTGERPTACLTDTAVVGNARASGHWQLLGVDDERRRAYYARVAHSAGYDCDSGVDRFVKRQVGSERHGN